MENMHFSTPHIQNLFDDDASRYYWVISLSRVVELTDGGNSQMGVLLVDMDYSSISRMMNQINTMDNGQYYYLCDSDGEIIYHRQQIRSVMEYAVRTVKLPRNIKTESMMRSLREAAGR